MQEGASGAAVCASAAAEAAAVAEPGGDARGGARVQVHLGGGRRGARRPHVPGRLSR